MVFIPRWWWHFIVAIDRETALQWRQQHDIDPVVDIRSATTITTSITDTTTDPTVTTTTSTTDTTTTTDTTSIPIASIPIDVGRRVRTPLCLPLPIQNTTTTQTKNENNDLPACVQATTAAPGNNTDLHTSSSGSSDSILRKRSRREYKESVAVDGAYNVDYSFSVSFWWGKRMILHYS